MSRYKFRPHSESGFGLIDVLVAIGLLGISIAVFTQNSKQIMDRKYDGDLLRQKTVLREMLLRSASCKSIVEKPCTGAVEPRQLFDSINPNRALVGLNKTPVYGNWRLEAYCNTKRELEVWATAYQTTAKNNGKDDDTDTVSLGTPTTGSALSKRMISNKSDSKTRVLDDNNERKILIEGGILCNRSTVPAGSGPIPPAIGESCIYDRDKNRLEMCDFPEKKNGDKKRCCEKSIPIQPSCSAGKRYASYWDRDGDWGVNGRWVVLCR